MDDEMTATQAATSLPPSRLTRLERWTQATRQVRRSRRLSDACGVAAFAVALALRFALDGILSSGFPFLTFFPAVIITTFACGPRPGTVCAVLSGVAAWFVFLTPRFSLTLTGESALALALFAFIVGVDILVIASMQSVSERLQREKEVSHRLSEQQRVLFQELQHRVANNMQFVASLLALQRRQAAGDPQRALLALDEARTRLETIARIHRRLYDPDSLDRPVGEYLQEICSDLIATAGAGEIVCRVEIEPLRLDLSRLTTLSLLVVEVVTNALKHAFPPGGPGTITIRLDRLGAGRARLTIADDGRGLSAGFDRQVGSRLGFRIVQSLAAQLGGGDPLRLRGRHRRAARFRAVTAAAGPSSQRPGMPAHRAVDPLEGSAPR
ncbi:signal transduction histidine kinase [Methylobacterium sp. 4-46]|uniref:sensor histidine kinase n=1 Tax=Methylobacterium sp. (strain 4-46) TaxID=426117 RepID=UPI000165CDC5|nr:histidine kinase dimerization/phosphoacceptor domain -containing protein [Methylobacterium sp. 4-46]ACA19180.1 signal transduction histidine kinase [Methylobacterium sp. 4-46]